MASAKFEPALENKQNSVPLFEDNLCLHTRNTVLIVNSFHTSKLQLTFRAGSALVRVSTEFSAEARWRRINRVRIMGTLFVQPSLSTPLHMRVWSVDSAKEILCIVNSRGTLRNQ